MSQHFYNADVDGLPVLVQMGWDKPLQRFYLVVFRVEEDGEADDVLYSNIDDCGAQAVQALGYFVSLLDQIGIQVPAAILAEVEHDKRYNLVNRVVSYAADGSVINRENHDSAA